MTLDEDYVMHTYGRFPIVIERGEGCYCYDTEGNKYLDLIGGIAVNILGYGDPVLGEAIGKQAKNIIHTSNLFYTIPQPRLAKRLTTLAGMRKAFFCNSGAEANEAALKLARKAAKLTGRETKTKIVSTYNSFHGRTLGAITATGQEKYQKSFLPLIPGFDYIEYNNIEQLDIIDDDTCAVIVEPIQGESGVHPATGEFLLALREKCDKYNVALIFDEVQTGMGRTGKLFAYMHFGVKPNILTSAKMIGGGFPMGCCMADEKYMDIFTPGDHASTFGGTPLACTAAMTVLDRMEELNLLENCTKMGEYFMEKLKTLPHLKEVRGKGLLIGVEFDKPVAKTISTEGFKHGVIMNSIGDSIIRLVPPLIIKKEDIDFAVDVIKKIMN
ncbi:MAG: aspartate aminotransferase family protein [Abditibacteriota bacterium]|nr:aspartate aminotransferase family protein [Abditibacteriota bacterium]